MDCLRTVAIARTDAQTRNQYIVDAIGAAFRARLGTAGHVLEVDYTDIGTLARSRDVDLFLAIGGAGAIAEPISRAAAAARRSALWTTEDPYELRENIKFAARFDMVFTNDSVALPYYQGNVRHLALAGARKYHDCPVRVAPSDLWFDLFFIGTAWPERVDQIDLLLDHLDPRLRRKIGLARNPHLPDRQISDLDLITDFRVSPREFARLANRSAVALTLDRTFSGDPSNDRKGETPPPRLFELALAGTAQVYVTGRSDVARYFEPDREIVVAGSIEEAARAIERLAADPVRRNAMAQAARERALAEHLYEHRVDEILTAMAALPPRAPTVAASDARRRVLFVSHNLAGTPPFGGVELYQDTLAAAVKGFDFHVLYFDRISERVSLKDYQTGEVRTFNAGPIPEGSISDPARERILGDLIGEFGFDLIHYQHLIGHPLSLPLVSRSFGVPSVFQVHDHYSLCQSFNLLDASQRYCGVRDHRTDVCDRCLLAQRTFPPGTQARRRWAFRTALDAVDVVLHSTESTLEKHREIYPDLDAAKHRVVGNAGRLETLRALARVRADSMSRRPGERLQVAAIGNFTAIKGAEELLAVFRQTAEDGIDFHVVGRIDAAFAAAFDDPELRHVTVHGAFDQETLPEILRDKDVSLHFSIWPETYCIALDEARAAGLVPVVLGYGALAVRVADGVDGIVVDPAHPMDLVQVLRRLAVDPTALERLRGDPTGPERQFFAHYETIEAIYRELVADTAPAKPDPAYRSRRPLLLDDLAFRFSNRDWSVEGVVFDDAPEMRNDAASAAEIAPAVEPELVTDGRPPSHGRLRPGDERITILVEGIGCSITRPKRIVCPVYRRTLRLGVGVPAGSGRDPCEITLVGPTVYRSLRLGRSRPMGGDDVSMCEWSIEAMEPGVYAVELGLRAGRRKLRYRSGIEIVVGGRDVATGGRTPMSGVAAVVPWASAEDLRRRAERVGRSWLGRSWAGGIERALGDFAALVRGNRPQLSIDHVAGRADVVSSVTVRLAETGMIGIGGWAVETRSKRAYVAIYARLSGGATMRVAVARQSRRADVAAHFGTPRALLSGFEVHIVLGDIDPGSYVLDLIAMDAAGRMLPARRFDLTIE